jgi:hypothetical protein
VFWPAEKSAAMHRYGTGHRVELRTFADIFPAAAA